MKLKVHGTLLQTGLLAASGSFAGVEESARQLAAGNWGESWRASYSLESHHLLQTLVSLVQRKEPDSSMLGTEGKLEGIVLSRVSSSVANVGLPRAEESARQLAAGNWDQLAAGNWEKAGGHCTLSSVIICCKRWSRS
jgi:hypothetical protein